MLRILIVKNPFKIEISLRVDRFCTEKEMLMEKRDLNVVGLRSVN